MTAQGHFWIFLMKEKSDGTGEEGGNDAGADLTDGDPGIRCNGHAASRLNAICSTHSISEDLLYDHFSGKTIFTWPDSHCFLDVTEYLKEKDIGMPGSCCLRRSGHCGRRLTPLIEGYIGARAGIVRQQAGVEAEAAFHLGLADRRYDPGAACPFSGQSGAAGCCMVSKRRACPGVCRRPDDRDRACLEQEQEVRTADHHHHADAVVGYGQPHPPHCPIWAG